jgi:hypothetical protein
MDFIRDMFRTQVQETEDVEEVSQSILNTAMDESGWGRMPKVVRESTPTTGVLPRNISAIDKELDYWLRSVPKGTHTDIDILDFWKNKESELPLLAKVAKKILRHTDYLGEFRETVLCSRQCHHKCKNLIKH